MNCYGNTEASRIPNDVAFKMKNAGLETGVSPPLEPLISEFAQGTWLGGLCVVGFRNGNEWLECFLGEAV
jgi:hypothetical protein